MKTFDDNFEEACRNLFEHAEFAPSNQLWNKIQSGMQGENLLERTVRQLFEKAEITPSERVWQGISNALHRPLIRPLWRWASAAAVALLIGGASYYFVGNDETVVENQTTDNSNPLAQETQKAGNPQPLSEKSKTFAESKTIVPVPNHDEITQIIRQTTENQVPTQTQKIVVPVETQDGGNSTINQASTDSRLIDSPINVSLLAFPTEPSYDLSIIKPVRLGLVGTPELINSETEIQQSYRHWVGVNVGLQDFQPHYQVSQTLSNNPFLAEKDLSGTDMRSALLDTQIQSAYQIGFEFARKFGKIVVVSVGLQQQNSEYTANVTLKQVTPTVQTPISISDELVVRQSSYGIPVLVGADWQAKNGVGLFVMTGLQTDFGQSVQIINRYTPAHYELGTYQKMNFTGLVRIGASYAISQHFSLGIETSYRQALENIYQTSHLASRPSWLGFGANLRYKF